MLRSGMWCQGSMVLMLVLLAGAGAARAGTLTAVMPVSATFSEKCTQFSVDALHFSGVAGQTGMVVPINLTVQCTQNTSWSVKVMVDAGYNCDRGVPAGKLTSASGKNYYYSLLDPAQQYLAPDTSTGCGNGQLSPITGTGTGATQSVGFYGYLNDRDADAGAGDYTGSPTLVLSF